MMFHLSPLLNILYKTIRYSGKNILRDFTEIENLQSSVKDTNEYINKSLKRLNENISVNLIKIKKNVSIVDIKQNPLTTCWIVSSVDSTISYSRGIPEFLIVVSYRENEKINECIFYNPINDEAFLYGIGLGGYKNSVKLRVSEKKKLSDSLVSVHVADNINKNNLSKIFESLIKREIRFRSNNSFFFELSLLSEGKLDALIFNTSNQNFKEVTNFVTRETGGFFIECLNKNQNLFIASNKYIGKLLKEMIEK